MQFVCCPDQKKDDPVATTAPYTAQVTSRLSEIAKHPNIKLINNECGLGHILKVGLFGGGGTEALIGKYPWM